MRGIGAALVVLLLVVGAAPARDVAGVTLAEEVSDHGRTLRLNGAGLRTKYLFKVYVAGLYTEAPTHDADAVVHGHGVRRVELHLVRALSADEVADALVDGVRRNAGDALPSLASRVERLKALCPAVQPGDVVVFQFVPGTGTVVTANDRPVGTIEGDDFASALLAVWLGASPVDASLKQALLGG
jgi:hypothetical protein